MNSAPSRSRSHALLSLAGALVLALAATGCSAGASTAAGPAAGTTQQAIATQEPGPLHAAGEAFAEVPLTSEQRTRIEALFRATEQRHAEAWKQSAAARKDLLLALADQVQAGAIDKAALQPKIEAAAAPWKAVREADRAALVELHGALSPEQRKAFVDAFPEKMRASFGGKHGHHEGHEGHDGRDHAEMAGPLGKMGHAWKELDLTSDQKDKLKEAFRSEMGGAGGKSMREAFAARREEGKKALESFKGDKFTGEGVFGGPDKAHDRVEKMIHFAEVALPILTPEQRAKAATLLRQRAEHAGEKPFAH